MNLTFSSLKTAPVRPSDLPLRELALSTFCFQFLRWTTDPSQRPDGPKEGSLLYDLYVAQAEAFAEHHNGIHVETRSHDPVHH